MGLVVSWTPASVPAATVWVCVYYLSSSVIGGGDELALGVRTPAQASDPLAVTLKLDHALRDDRSGTRHAAAITILCRNSRKYNNNNNNDNDNNNNDNNN